MKKTRRILMIVFTIAVFIAITLVMITTASATEVIASGECGANGNNMTWMLDSDGVLTIEGSGVMRDYSNNSDAPWYSYNENVEIVCIKNGVTSIGRNAFYGCKMKSIILPNSIKTIEKNAIRECCNLTNVDIPEGATDIGVASFLGCENLVDIRISSTVMNIGNGAFADCENLEKIIVNENNTAFHYDGNCLIKTSEKTLISGQKNSIIPSDGSVTNIGEYAFYKCKDLTNIVIPYGITNIGYSAFSECNNLISIELPQSVIKIDDYAFDECENLTSIEIPSSVTYIGEYAFYGCKKITSMEIPDGIETINASTFYGCTKLTDIKLPNSISTIDTWAFGYCKSLTGINLPSNLISIGNMAFYSCYSIQSVSIPCSVTQIGENAFGYCSNLEKVNITDIIAWCNIDFANELSNPLSCGIDLYINDELLYEIFIPDEVKAIKKYTFNYCKNIFSVFIGNGVTEINENAFNSCSNLFKIGLSASLTKIDQNAFRNCSRLIYIINDSDLELKNKSDDYGYIAKNALVIVDENGKRTYSLDKYNYIEDENYFLFREKGGNYELISYLGNEKEVTFPEYISGNEYTIRMLTDNLFSVIVPGTVKIGDQAFFSIENLRKIRINEGVTEIGIQAINCPGLTEIYLPNSLKKICYFAFSNCSKLKEIIIPKGLESIGSGAFGYCYQIEKVCFGESLTEIGDGIFLSCNKLNVIEVDHNNQSYASVDGVLFNKEMTVLIAYPAGKISSSYTVPEGVTTINDHSFSGSKNLSNIFLSSSVNEIKSQAFSNSGLTEIVIPDSVTKIGDNAFYSCDNLAYVKIGKGIMTIERETFSECEKLQNVEISYSVNSIGYCAFRNCKKLNEIIISPNVIFIDDTAFTQGILGSTRLAIKFCGYDDSYIESFCAEKGFEFVSLGSMDSILIESLFDYYELDDGTLEIAAFFGRWMREVEIPSQIEEKRITSINGAFRNCRNLQSVQIPYGVKIIGHRSFFGCSDLLSIRIPNSVLTIGDETFYGCKNLIDVVIPDSVATIGSYAFSACNNLESISLGSGIKTIERNAFSSCSKLTSIVIPDSVTSLGVSVFFGCNNLESVKLGNGLTNIDRVFSWCGITSIIIPNSVKEIGYGAFSYCENLTSIEIPKDITRIDSGAFVECNNLKYIYGYKKGIMGSRAEDYANNYGYIFVNLYEFPVIYSFGDVSIESTREFLVEDASCSVRQDEKNLSELGISFKSYSKYVVYDISLEKDGEKVQPDGDVTIKIKLPEGYDAAKCQVWHIDENGNRTNMKAKVENGYFVFKTNHFSLYAIVELDHIPGDIIGDGELNNKDLTRLFQFLSEWDVNVNDVALDINGDGKVNNKDLTRLFRYLTGWDVEIY